MKIEHDDSKTWATVEMSSGAEFALTESETGALIVRGRRGYLSIVPVVSNVVEISEVGFRV